MTIDQVSYDEVDLSLLEDLMLPATPESVRQKYFSLPKLAAEQNFGLLEDDVVVLDTETTGLSFKDCTLIEISAARLRGREIVDRYETFVHPGCPIPPEITRLTSITDLDVTDAPDARTAVAGLVEFVGGSPVLAHNATFDRTFIEAVPGGHEVSDIWIDTLALSRIALPRLSSHRLQDMARAFGCASVTHRACDDVDALCGMWRVILCALSQMPAGLMGYLADMHPEVDWPFRPVFSQLALGDTGEYFHLKAARAELLREDVRRAKEDAAEEGKRLFDVDLDAVDQAFAPGGTVSRMYEKAEERPEQVAMAREIAAALNTSTHRSIEAGTGVGKSIAYLLPEVLYAQRNNVTVGVATKTNALTDQLVAHELPALAAALPGGMTFHALKGYDHYPCFLRMDRAVKADLPVEEAKVDGRSENAVSCDMLTALAVCYAYACQSPDGDLDALGIRWRYVPRKMLTISSGDCLKNRCPYFPRECLLHGARRRAAASDVVVTNHSLLLRNVAAEGRILPPVRHWVVDEAHGFESEARRQWAVEVCAGEARSAFEVLGGTKTGALHSLLVGALSLENSTLVTGLLTKVAAEAATASVRVADLFVAIHELVPLAKSDGSYDDLTLWIDAGLRQSDEWGEVVRAGQAAAHALDEVTRHMKEARKALAEVAPQMAGDLGDAGRALDELLAGIKLICDGTDTNYVYYAQLTRAKRRLATEKLVAEKIDIGADLAKDWLPEMESVVFTSATIAVGDNFDHFNQSVGLAALDSRDHKDLRLSSSFDYERQMSVVLARDMPAPNDRAYLPALEDLLYDVHVAMGGSVLTLFTNRRDMERVAQALKPRLAAAGLDLAYQERGTSPRRLRERFNAEKNLSLMALKSFWEGFDAAGDTLRCVVIPKLPFANPNEPLVKERELREERAWWHYSLPEAVIEVKQAAGRLIRTSSDTGVLVLADSRLATKSYGKLFMKSLPNQNATMLESANVGRYIKMWRASHE